MTSKYRKKPVVIEAIQYTEDNMLEIHAFCRDHNGLTCVNGIIENGGLIIKTLEDGSDGEAKHIASVGDYIIKGIQGEFYPCKPDIFHQTYEAVSNDLVTSQDHVDEELFRIELSVAEEMLASVTAAIDKAEGKS